MGKVEVKTDIDRKEPITQPKLSPIIESPAVKIQREEDKTPTQNTIGEK
jgi:hypothetical protein